MASDARRGGQAVLEAQLGILRCTAQQLEELEHVPDGRAGSRGADAGDGHAGACWQVSESVCTLATADAVVPPSCLLLDELTDDVLAQVFGHYLSPLQVCLVARWAPVLADRTCAPVLADRTCAPVLSVSQHSV